jgi:hypothetical protein
MGRVLDSRAVAQHHPAAAKVLVTVLDALRRGSAPRRGGLALVRSMTEERR